MIKWFILGGLVGITIKEIISINHYTCLYDDLLNDLLKEIDDE